MFCIVNSLETGLFGNGSQLNTIHTVPLCFCPGAFVEIGGGNFSNSSGDTHDFFPYTGKDLLLFQELDVPSERSSDRSCQTTVFLQYRNGGIVENPHGGPVFGVNFGLVGLGITEGFDEFIPLDDGIRQQIKGRLRRCQTVGVVEMQNRRQRFCIVKLCSDQLKACLYLGVFCKFFSTGKILFKDIDHIGTQYGCHKDTGILRHGLSCLQRRVNGKPVEKRLVKELHGHLTFTECTLDEVIDQSGFILVDVVEHLSVNIVRRAFKTVVFAETAAVNAPDAIFYEKAHLISTELRRPFGEESHTVVPPPVVNIGGKAAFDLVFFPGIKVFLSIITKLNDHIWGELLKCFGRIRRRTVTDDMGKLSGKFFVEPFGKFSVKDPQLFPFIRSVAVSFAIFTLTGRISVSLGKLNSISSLFCPFDHFLIDQLLYFRIGNTKVVPDGIALAAPEGKVVRMCFCIFFDRNSIVVRVSAIAFEITVTVGVVGITVEHIRSMAGKYQFGNAYFLQPGGNGELSHL